MYISNYYINDTECILLDKMGKFKITVTLLNTPYLADINIATVTDSFHGMRHEYSCTSSNGSTPKTLKMISQGLVCGHFCFIINLRENKLLVNKA